MQPTPTQPTTAVGPEERAALAHAADAVAAQTADAANLAPVVRKADSTHFLTQRSGNLTLTNATFGSAACKHDLSVWRCHKPDPGFIDDRPVNLSLRCGPLNSQTYYTPEEARRIAAALIQCAAEAELDMWAAQASARGPQ